MNNEAINIFCHDPAGPESLYNSKHFRPEPAIISLALSSTGNRYGLAGEAAGDDVNLERQSGLFRSVNSNPRFPSGFLVPRLARFGVGHKRPDIAESHGDGEVALKHSSAPGVDFDLPDGVDPGPGEPKVKNLLSRKISYRGSMEAHHHTLSTDLLE
jgi:hypothetical protein